MPEQFTFDVSGIERGDSKVTADSIWQLQASLDSQLKQIYSRLSDIWTFETGEIFRGSERLIVNRGFDISASGTASAITFSTAADGLAGAVGAASGLITGAAVDRLGLRGTSGIEFSADDGASRHGILGSDGFLQLLNNADGHRLHLQTADGKRIIELGGGFNAGPLNSAWFGTNLNSTTLTPAQSDTGQPSWLWHFSNAADVASLRRLPAGGASATLLSVDSSGVLSFGSHSAIGAETVTGFITIKDAAGNTRKLAVVS